MQHRLVSRYTIHRQDEMLVGKGKMDQCRLSVFPLKQCLIEPAATQDVYQMPSTALEEEITSNLLDLENLTHKKMHFKLFLFSFQFFIGNEFSSHILT